MQREAQRCAWHIEDVRFLTQEQLRPDAKQCRMKCPMSVLEMSHVGPQRRGEVVCAGMAWEGCAGKGPLSQLLENE